MTAEAGVAWTETDVDADPALRAEFGELVPVVRVDGKELGYWRIDEGASAARWADLSPTARAATVRGPVR